MKHFSLLAAAFLATPCLADVIDVGGPTPDFVTVQEAVDAAVSGDQIRVYPGLWNAFEVDAKTLTFFPGSPVGTVEIEGVSRIINLASTDSAEIEGFEFRNSEFIDLNTNPQGVEIPTLQIENCLGAIRMRNCAINRLWTGDAVQSKYCSDVALVNCEIRGGWGIAGFGAPGAPDEYVALEGGHGILVLDSNVSLYSCTIGGGMVEKLANRRLVGIGLSVREMGGMQFTNMLPLQMRRLACTWIDASCKAVGGAMDRHVLFGAAWGCRLAGTAGMRFIGRVPAWPIHRCSRAPRSARGLVEGVS